MIEVSIRMAVPADKRMEILQTIKVLLGTIRRESGCINCGCCVDVESEDILIFNQEWETNQDLVAHLKSYHFGVLLGAMKLLSIEPEVRFNTIASTAGKEVIIATRCDGNPHEFITDQ